MTESENYSLDGKSILVTGGTGSFGTKFIAMALKRYKPRRLVVFSRDELKQFEFNDYLTKLKLKKNNEIVLIYNLKKSL